MKKSFFYFVMCSLFVGCIKPECPNPVSSTSGTTKTVVLQPGSEGIDAAISDYYPTTNYGNREDVLALSWTYSGTTTNYRSFINFDFSSVPAGAQIQSAKLSLFGDTSTVFLGPQGHSSLTGPNDCSLKRVTSQWDENTITWNNQPTFDDINKVTIPASIGNADAYIVDVTQLVKEQITNPTLYYGIMLQLNNESPYRKMIFYSSDGPYAELRPKLEITYAK